MAKKNRSMVVVPEESKVAAGPAKRFFVDMLTRDIDLKDAVLDLLDNCVDGILRSEGEAKGSKPYDKYWAHITFHENHFIIEDNCGGIPLEKAEKYAFMIGKPDVENENLPTVGVYGIGMKRAIFKMGRSCAVTSHTEKKSFEVKINPDWFKDEVNWDLKATTIPRKKEPNGTKIEIKNLLDPISKQFGDSSSSFRTQFIKTVEANYSFIMAKGFEVRVNGEKIVSKQLSLRKSNNITPYVYEATLEGVHGPVKVFLAIGFTRAMPDSDELDDDEKVRHSSENAGWTVVCNDRVVLYCDKTRLTGWGESGVPNYHTQFLGISGIVEFKSNHPLDLPMTTTKRGVDASSDTYLYVKDFMREGMQLFASFTNKWKVDWQAQKKIVQSAPLMSMKQLRSFSSRKAKVLRGKPKEKRIMPSLPFPKIEKTDARISFMRPILRIEAVAEKLFEDREKPASEVGAECFDRAFSEIK